MNLRRFVLPLIAVAFCSAFAASPAAAGPTALSKCQRITKPGPYIVTKAITAPTGAQYCFQIEIDNVSIDLDGFTITGQGVGNGVSDNATMYKNITIRNGSIRNFYEGIYLVSSDVTVEKITASDNVDNGIILVTNGIVRDCTANRNYFGIYVFNALVTGNIAIGNTNYGIVAYGSNLVGNRVSNTILSESNSTRYNNNPAP